MHLSRCLRACGSSVSPQLVSADLKTSANSSARYKEPARRNVVKLCMATTMAFLTSLPVFFRNKPATPISPARPSRRPPAARAATPSDPDTLSPPNPKSQHTDERRRRISDSLKGRTLSAPHKAALSARFAGTRNPNYGRRMSPATKAKIGAAVSAAAARRRAAAEAAATAHPPPPAADEGVIERLRERAASSKLVTGGPRGDDAANAAVDRLLSAVRKGEMPPEVVERMRRARPMAARRKKMCDGCDGSGFTKCLQCAARFGSVSARCERCMGAGVAFCEVCQGAGVALKRR